ncbi:uncharacterized protein bbg [Prorops nasuta]|uniref:uncharacterized protein bbg n=1 Tax=Prorops nasuta TaxID=863751 RepID=UPI0034CDFD45
MEAAKEDFVTVVSVGSQPVAENFVTVLSIGNSDKKDAESAANCHQKLLQFTPEVPLEEEVEVFRLPGERLGFGLKFEGGNKSSERVRRLFVQSCAEQSPASRAKCSWGTLGEGDEVLSIDGVPVTHMTRLDCVRRLKESQLMIRLRVRCRGALRPEVVSAERKTTLEKTEVPPAPPPVPPRKLRQSRGSADGDANPSPVNKPWPSPKVGSPAQSQRSSKSTPYESCESSPKSEPSSNHENPKEIVKNKQEPPEPLIYLNARSLCGSTHGSTSDETSSSMSTVVDRFSSSDRVSTISTVSTASTTSEQLVDAVDSEELSSDLRPFEDLEREFQVNPPDYLLRRLTSSEAVTFVESRGEVERITAVVAPNLVLIEETITLQPPLSFQDAPLSYGHEARPDLFYAADLAVDSTTHFRPIKDDKALVEHVNRSEDQEATISSSKLNYPRRTPPHPPPLPPPPPPQLRNHINRININQNKEGLARKALKNDSNAAPRGGEPPTLPPKPFPRKDLKLKRKRPPPPPPPPISSSSAQINSSYENYQIDSEAPCPAERKFKPEADLSEQPEQTNKVLEIIEMRKTRSLTPVKEASDLPSQITTNSGENLQSKDENGYVDVIIPLPRKDFVNSPTTSNGLIDSIEKVESLDENTRKQSDGDKVNGEVEEMKNRSNKSKEARMRNLDDLEKSMGENIRKISNGYPEDMSGPEECKIVVSSPIEENGECTNLQENESRNDSEMMETNCLVREDIFEEEDTSEESDDGDYYWQSNLATIGEEEETNSLEYTNVDKNVDCDDRVAEVSEDQLTVAKEKVVQEKDAGASVRMENCEDGQRLPPDGDEFPAAYQEFGENQQYLASRSLKTATLDPVGSLPEDSFAKVDYDATGYSASGKKHEEAAYRKSSEESPKKEDAERCEDYTETPPPLPLTRPPQVDQPPPVPQTRTSPLEPKHQQKKFSLSVELWRQDDKSEKSVRDKIAMFSSQSNLDSPIFPVNPANPPVSVSNRKLSKYKSSDDVSVDGRPTSGQREKPSHLCTARTNSSFDITDSAKNPEDLQKCEKNPPTADPDTSVKSSNDVSGCTNAKPPTTVARSTSFSGTGSYSQDSNSSGDNSHGPQVCRTNSLASTFRRSSDDFKKNSLSQLIEQRRKSISKLRGLVIPEKDAVSIDQPIVDLPEIKSRDSILNQIPKGGLQDKWGSQSSIASSTSTTSVPLKPTASFKMPAPQIHSKYSPAFKRKSLSVYDSASSVTNGSASKTQAPLTPQLAGEPPKSLESISSPTRSDYSFEYIPTTNSPDTLRARSKLIARKTRLDYDDSDNDSAVSSSQSSISRGFSPPLSPAPSEKSTISSERSAVSTDSEYQRRSLLDSPVRSYNIEREQLASRPNTLGETICLQEKSTESTESRALQLENTWKASQIPQRLKRSNSTDTNSSSSSTLTSGSQSTDSSSRRVLKAQSVEAINRKNILASARCRSGRDLSGSPLIQRKFNKEEPLAENGLKLPVSKYNGVQPVVKVAYIEVTEKFFVEEKAATKLEDAKTQISVKAKYESENSKTWTRGTEVVNRVNWVKEESRRSTEDKNGERLKEGASSVCKRKIVKCESEGVAETSNCTKSMEQNDLLTVLKSNSRSRSGIHINEATLGGTRKSEMSLEEILSAKEDSKLLRKSNVDIKAEKDALTLSKTSQELKETRYNRKLFNSEDSNVEERGFVSKIPTLDRLKNSPSIEEPDQVAEKLVSSRIPMARNIGRRSASVTDVKKVFEKMDSATSKQSNHQTVSHNRFPSLDSSLEPNVCSPTAEEKHCGEQFGSISSLASSTSLISQQELAQLVEDASLEDTRNAQDVIVVLLHKENPVGSVGITLAGGVDCEIKEITVHRVLTHSIADKDGRVRRGDRILSINGRSTRGLTHRESLAILKQPRSEVVLVISRPQFDEVNKLKFRTESVETIPEGHEANDSIDNTAWGPPTIVQLLKEGAGLGFSLEGGRNSLHGNRPLVIKKIFTGGAAEKTGTLKAGDQLLEVSGNDVTRMSRIEAWNLMKNINNGAVNLLVRHSAAKSS